MPSNTIVFATNNEHKIREVREMLGEHYQFLSLADINCFRDLPETRETLEGNAKQKAAYVVQHFDYDCFAEDTGLEVDALYGEPGVRTARYAGEARDERANMAKLLAKLTGQTKRTARFRTVIALMLDGKTHLFEGVVEGRIAEEPRGEGGFGYDPIFIPEGHDRTFAEMGPAEKNPISHRGLAMAKLQEFLRTQVPA